MKPKRPERSQRHNWLSRHQLGLWLAGLGGPATLRDFATYTREENKAEHLGAEKPTQNKGTKTSDLCRMLRDNKGKCSLRLLEKPRHNSYPLQYRQPCDVDCYEQGTDACGQVSEWFRFFESQTMERGEAATHFRGIEFQGLVLGEPPPLCPSNGPTSVGWWVSTRRLAILDHSKKWQSTDMKHLLMIWLWMSRVTDNNLNV